MLHFNEKHTTELKSLLTKIKDRFKGFPPPLYPLGYKTVSIKSKHCNIFFLILVQSHYCAGTVVALTPKSPFGKEHNIKAICYSTKYPSVKKK